MRRLHNILTHTFNSHVSSATNPCINKAIHVLLMLRFGSLNTLIWGHYILRQLIRFDLALEHGNVQPPYCEMATKYSVILYVNLDEYIFEFMQNNDQT